MRLQRKDGAWVPVAIEPRPRSGRRLGCGGALFFLFWLSLVAIGTIRSCTTDLAKAVRIKQSDPCEAARVFGNVARKNLRFDSSQAISELIGTPGPCSLKEMIDLMDIPDGPHVGPYQREDLWKEIRIRTAGMKPAPPEYYDPRGEQETREREKKQWLEWFRIAFPQTHPSTVQ